MHKVEASFLRSYSSLKTTQLIFASFRQVGSSGWRADTPMAVLVCQTSQLISSNGFDIETSFTSLCDRFEIDAKMRKSTASNAKRQPDFETARTCVPRLKSQAVKFTNVRASTRRSCCLSTSLTTTDRLEVPLYLPLS